MGYLENKQIYLAGPIEFDLSENWRVPVLDVLTNRFKINVFDPSIDEKQNKAKLIDKALEEGNYDEVECIARQFVKKDLGTIQRSSALIACNLFKVPTTGTPTEVMHAVNLKQPVMIVCPQGKKFASRWYFGCIKHQYIFGSWNELYDYLDEVDRGLHKNNHRWAFVYDLV